MIKYETLQINPFFPLHIRTFQTDNAHRPECGVECIRAVGGTDDHNLTALPTHKGCYRALHPHTHTRHTFSDDRESRQVRSCATMRRSISLCAWSRLVVMASISSMKSRHGDAAEAAANNARICTHTHMIHTPYDTHNRSTY